MAAAETTAPGSPSTPRAPVAEAVIASQDTVLLLAVPAVANAVAQLRAAMSANATTNVGRISGEL